MAKQTLCAALCVIALLLGCDSGNSGGSPLPDGDLEVDTLYAIAQTTAVAVGDEVQVVVATGVPAHAFQYMNGCGLTIEADAVKVAGSFNVGEPGGQPDAADGIWASMHPAGGFLLPPDSFIVATDIGGGRERWDFNVTPIDGSELASAEGELFNYKFTFASAGTKTFGFQESLGVDRTYYSDGANTLYHWSDISNADGPTVSVN